MTAAEEHDQREASHPHEHETDRGAVHPIQVIALGILGVVPIAASAYFAVFWSAFVFWRRHRTATYAMMFGAVGAAAIGAYVARAALFAAWLAVPVPVQALGWAVMAAATIFGTVADRQIGLRVRSFAPFFDDTGRIELVTTGAYAVVRHPIYASGIAFQLGIALVTGYVAVAVACVAFGASAAWFTRQEERRLVGLLRDPAAYERYRARVPALLPFLRQ